MNFLAYIRNLLSTPTPAPSPRVILENALNAEELREAFNLDDSSEQWRAIHQLIDAQVGDMVDTVAAAPRADVPEAHRAWVAGGIDALRSLQQALIELRAAARKAETEADTEAG